MEWSLKQAAEACGVSVDTVKRRIKTLEELGAYKNARGAWRVTPEQLRGAGLKPGVPLKRTGALHQGTEDAPGAQGGAEVEKLRARVVELEAALKVEKARVEAAERVAEERSRSLDLLARSLRVLEAPRAEPVREAEPEPNEPKEPDSPRGFFSRFLGR